MRESNEKKKKELSIAKSQFAVYSDHVSYSLLPHRP